MSEPLRLAACLPALLGPAVLLLPGAAGAQGSPALTVRPIPGVAVEWPAAPPGPAPAPAQPAPAARTIVLTLRQLGAAGPLSLRGTTPELGASFGLRADEVVTAATLSLSGAISAALLPGLSSVTVTLNGEYLGTIAAMRELREPARASLMHGDLVLLSGDTLTSYRVGPAYTVGDLPLWLWPVWYLRGQPWAALGVVVGAGLILVFGLAWLLTPRAGRERRG